MRILKDETAGIIIDVQEKLYPHIFNHEELVKNLLILIEGLKILNIPIIVTQQYTKGLGATIETVKLKLGEINPIEKISFSCCDESSVIRELNLLNKKYIILAGIEAHVCVLQTVLDLIDNGYVPVVVQDCVSSRNDNNKRIAIDRIRQEGAVVTTYESILLELCRVAGSDTFRKISSLIK